MDFTPADLNAPETEPASFSYRIFLDDRTFLIEETILATPTPMVGGHLVETGAAVGTGGKADDTVLLELLRRQPKCTVEVSGALGGSGH